ncbi:hypothetical protein DUI87_02544 [Hirundo rustica rustica]|uniref:Non-reducing end beta-L-arabinofuranosidase-like GH127 catalytic domain-containing protein n=1 Tax=Hirundo rustica rustica TaxID=333673 RepID=A0A3M0L9J0_HIRRU|nr:hypothetical protein DUI87_02544 [Hirundo rustica rustica]
MDSISQVIHDCETCAAIKQAKRVKPLWKLTPEAKAALEIEQAITNRQIHQICLKSTVVYDLGLKVVLAHQQEKDLFCLPTLGREITGT